jgi:hypothetical protein
MRAEDIRRGGPAPIPKNGEAKKVAPVRKALPQPKLPPMPRHVPSSGPLQKVPWCGDWAIFKAGAYMNGLSKDKSGVDAINYWATTATQQEIDDMHRRAKSMGWLTGFTIGVPVFGAIFRKLFGNG